MAFGELWACSGARWSHELRGYSNDVKGQSREVHTLAITSKSNGLRPCIALQVEENLKKLASKMSKGLRKARRQISSGR